MINQYCSQKEVFTSWDTHCAATVATADLTLWLRHENFTLYCFAFSSVLKSIDCWDSIFEMPCTCWFVLTFKSYKYELFRNIFSLIECLFFHIICWCVCIKNPVKIALGAVIASLKSHSFQGLRPWTPPGGLQHPLEPSCSAFTYSRLTPRAVTILLERAMIGKDMFIFVSLELF